MPVVSKIISVELTGATADDTEFGVLLNKSTGDVWHAKAQADMILFNLANKNYLGEEPTHWTDGDLLEIVVFGSAKKGATTHTLIDGNNDVVLAMGTDTAVEVNL